MKLKETIKKCAPFFKKHRKAIIVALIILLAFVILAFGIKIALFINFFLGNDIIVKLDVSNESMSLLHGQSQEVLFEASITTNPFCTASCTSEFVSVSAGLVLDEGNFTLKPGFPMEKRYTISSKPLGAGQELYRFSMGCSSVRTALCHTDEEPTRRSILITADYDLSENEKLLKEDLKVRLEQLRQRLESALGVSASFNETALQLSKLASVNWLWENSTLISEQLSGLVLQLKYLQEVWKRQDYSSLPYETAVFSEDLSEIEANLSVFNTILLEFAVRYNEIISNLTSTRAVLNNLSNRFITNDSAALEINSSIEKFNFVLEIFNKTHSFADKQKVVSSIAASVSALSSRIRNAAAEEAVRKYLEMNTAYDALCEISGECFPHISLRELSEQEEFDLAFVCAGVDLLQDRNMNINNSMGAEFAAQAYPETGDFWANVSAAVSNIKRNISAAYIAQLPVGAPNSELIRRTLVLTPFVDVPSYDFNLTPAFVAELVKQQPSPCEVANITIENISDIGFEKISISPAVEVILNVSFDEPLLQCCVFGDCRPCCTSFECENNPKNFPVMFLHGHSLNEEVSADYSLDAFNKLQKQLEEEGYVDAGAITLYTGQSVQQGIWGIVDAPLSIKASYYFDLFKAPENYVIVQTKSESIDTYAVRLKELIDRVKYRTGKPKVNIIATSMGGLVARRYVQVFGTGDVGKLILIATPNNGIEGNVADFCPLIGENLECRDMKSGSLFLNKLNRGKQPDIPVYNIVGSGCQMNQGTGDGLVLKESALLAGATNYVVNGTCRKLELLHSKILDIDEHPDVYGIILNALKE